MTDRETETEETVEADETGRVVLVGMMAASARVCAARLDTNVTGEEFVALLEALEIEIRADERADCENERDEIPAPMAATHAMANAPNIKTKLMTAVDAKHIQELVAMAPRTGTGKLKQGFANQVGADLGYTVSQVQSVIYGKVPE